MFSLRECRVEEVGEREPIMQRWAWHHFDDCELMTRSEEPVSMPTDTDCGGVPMQMLVVYMNPFFANC